MKKVIFDLLLSWTDLNGICHNLLIDRMKLLPGDHVDSVLKFTVPGGVVRPGFDAVDEKIRAPTARHQSAHIPS